MAKKGSRLTRTLERQSKKQLFIFIFASILIITVLGFFSTTIIDTIGNLMIADDSERDIANEHTVQPVTPPHFDNLPQATDSDSLNITGNVSRENGTVEIFVNNRKASSQEVKSGTEFEFRGIKLNEGENTVKGRYILNDRASEFTKIYVIHYTKEPPKLDEVSPSDGEEFKRGDQEIEVKGKTEPNNTVTVNDFRAIVNTQGEFSYFFKLNEGSNTIRIKATSPTGKETVKELKVSYHP